VCPGLFAGLAFLGAKCPPRIPGFELSRKSGPGFPARSRSSLCPIQRTVMNLRNIANHRPRRPRRPPSSTAAAATAPIATSGRQSSVAMDSNDLERERGNHHSCQVPSVPGRHQIKSSIPPGHADFGGEGVAVSSPWSMAWIVLVDAAEGPCGRTNSCRQCVEAWLTDLSPSTRLDRLRRVHHRSRQRCVRPVRSAYATDEQLDFHPVRVRQNGLMATTPTHLTMAH